jgi:anhydro-N-acetylmuramic acid kinase
MEKNFSALGFMSGTSGDGVDTSVISSNGKDIINVKYNRFDAYPTSLSNKILKVKENISQKQDLLKYSSDIEELELQITDFHTDIAIKVSKEIDFSLIGFHGHTIYHNTDQKISKQIGLGVELSKVTKKTVVYDFRKEDIINGGEGAPLSPIYHLALIKKLYNEHKVKIPISILNIGGIANITENQ